MRLLVPMLLVVVVAVLGSALGEERKHNDAIASCAAALLEQVSANGAVETGAALQRGEGAATGATALAALALLRSGATDSEKFPAMIRYCVENWDETSVFPLSVLAILFTECKQHGVTLPKAFSDKMLVTYRERLESGQRASGMWGYETTGKPDDPDTQGDNSLTLYACLALSALERDSSVDGRLVKAKGNRNVDTWANTLKHLSATQNSDGGWGYRPGSQSTPAMTASGIICSLLALRNIKGGEAHVGRSPEFGIVHQASGWMNHYFDFYANARYFHFGLYAMALLAEVAGMSHFRGSDVLASGMLEATGKGPEATDIAFDLLFQASATKNLRIRKLVSNSQSVATDPFDCLNLLESTPYQTRPSWSLTCEKEMQEGKKRMYSLLYICDRDVAMTEATRKLLLEKTELEQTVFLFARSVENDKEFDEGVASFAREAFPNCTLSPAGKDSPFFTNPVVIAKGNRPEILVLLSDVTYKPRVIYIRDKDFSASLSQKAEKRQALEIGLNIIKSAGLLYDR